MDHDAAFERFVREHTSTLERTAYLLTGSRHGAEELVQDTLTLLYPRWAKVVAADSSLAYVRRSMTNRFVSVKRSPASRHESLWELPDRWDGKDVGESVAVSQTMWQLLEGLPHRQRAALVLRFLHDLPDAEIAAAVGCREVTVRSLASRGLAAMRAAYLETGTTAEGSLR